jgi:hypothetical protein
MCREMVQAHMCSQLIEKQSSQVFYYISLMEQEDLTR